MGGFTEQLDRFVVGHRTAVDSGRVAKRPASAAAHCYSLSIPGIAAAGGAAPSAGGEIQVGVDKNFLLRQINHQHIGAVIALAVRGVLGCCDAAKPW